MKILAVDDDQVALDLLSISLKNAGYEDVISVTSGCDALEQIQSVRIPFQCILLDICMPGMDGVELCQKIRSIQCYANIPILMITAVTDQERLRHALSVGATDYINKPLNGVELGTRVRAAGVLARLLKAVEGDHTNEVSDSEDSPLRLSDPIALDLNRGSVSLDVQVSQLIDLPPGSYSMGILAFALTNMKDIFTQASSSQYRKLINEIATAVTSSLPTDDFSIAYAGGGVFTLVVHCRHKTGCLRECIRDQLKMLPLPVNLRQVSSLDVRFDGSAERNIWSGNSAAIALTKACRNARQKVAEENEDNKLQAWRLALRNSSEGAGGPLSLARRFQEFGVAVDKILPRRVKTRAE